MRNEPQTLRRQPIRPSTCKYFRVKLGRYPPSTSRPLARTLPRTVRPREGDDPPPRQATDHPRHVHVNYLPAGEVPPPPLTRHPTTRASAKEWNGRWAG